MQGTWIKITSVLLLFLFPAAAISADTVGLIHVSGPGATLDGRPFSDSMNVALNGERLATGPSSKATVTSRGTTVSLASNTSVQLGKALQLINGSVVVSSDGGSTTKVDDITIATPPGAHAKFLAQRDRDELRLLAMEGTVDMIDGQESTPVPAVKGMKIKLPKSDSSNAAPHRHGAAWTWLHNDDVGAMLVIAGAIAAGVALGVINSQSQQTPVTPQ